MVAHGISMALRFGLHEPLSLQQKARLALVKMVGLKAAARPF